MSERSEVRAPTARAALVFSTMWQAQNISAVVSWAKGSGYQAPFARAKLVSVAGRRKGF